MEKNTHFVLTAKASIVAVIIADNETELKEKLATAIKEEVNADSDGQFELTLGRLGDWGESAYVRALYVADDVLVDDDDFELIKTICYR